MNKYWKRKVEIATEISAENGLDFDESFWSSQPSAVITLLLNVAGKSIYICDKCYDSLGDWDGVCDCIEIPSKKTNKIWHSRIEEPEDGSWQHVVKTVSCLDCWSNESLEFAHFDEEKGGWVSWDEDEPLEKDGRYVYEWMNIELLRQ